MPRSWELTGAFYCAADWDVRSFTGRPIRTVQELYSEDIFGKAQLPKCACGALVGTNLVGQHCMTCGTNVVVDRSGKRRQLIGRLELVNFVSHPVDTNAPPDWDDCGVPGLIINSLPIAPIAYRIDEFGKPNAIGKKYEEIVSMNEELGIKASAAINIDSEREIMRNAQAVLRFAIDDLIGFSGAIGGARPGTMLFEFWDALITFDPNAITLARSCLLSLAIISRIP